MILTGLLSFGAGLLTVLAPCVLPFLPIIVGGSLRGHRSRPYIVAASLIASLLAFTLLLKASTALIGIDPRWWSIISGVIVVLLGIAMLFPDLWTRVSLAIGFDQKSHNILDRAVSHEKRVTSAVLTGAALGPVFSSCSPTYAWVIATVLPASPVVGLIYLGLYCVGVGGALLAFSLLGRKLVDRVQWAANPRGWFQRSIAVLFIIIGLAVSTGVDKRFETWAVSWAPSFTEIENKLLPSDNDDSSADAAAPTQSSGTAAPDFQGIDTWINSDPLSIDELRGKVVLVDFWTYSCINCVRTQPYLNEWYNKYHDDGLVIVGVHAPEFTFEKDPKNVERAVEEAGIKYPVALDNDFATWNAYKNKYWPAKYLIDAQGNVQYTHFGEGEYEDTEKAIQQLLDVRQPVSTVDNGLAAGVGQSPETYLGTQRARNFQGDHPLRSGTGEYDAAGELDSDEWTLGGNWDVQDEKITADKSGATLTYVFDGAEMYLVMSGRTGATVHVSVEGEPDAFGDDVTDGRITLDGSRLYHLVHLPEPRTKTTVKLTFDEGVSAHAFTFGG